MKNLIVGFCIGVLLGVFGLAHSIGQNAEGFAQGLIAMVQKAKEA